MLESSYDVEWIYSHIGTCIFVYNILICNKYGYPNVSILIKKLN